MFVYHIAQRLSLPPFEQDDCRVVSLSSVSVIKSVLALRQIFHLATDNMFDKE
jgi:hypothetical protein